MSQTEAAAPLLVTEPVAAKMLSISPRKLFDLRKRGEVRAVRLGKCVRYDVRELKQLAGRCDDGKRGE